MEAKIEKTWFPKVIEKHVKTCYLFDQFWGPIGVQRGARKVQIRGPKSDLHSSRVPGALRGSIWDLFLTILGAIFR